MGQDKEVNYNDDCVVGHSGVGQHVGGKGGVSAKETAEKDGSKPTESTIAASGERGGEWASWSGKNNRTVPRFVRRLDYCAEVGNLIIVLR